ncbi:hypothetical protein [Paenibacillus sp. YYML68]|uniref:hypothetical protein n=1 Tax=Paenibacillus sp. YYML68 TaxID=2909250 RepID=UPI0024900B2A|nr:hypothetical protein [Paenibacillus sp. YYML68]
MSGIASETSPDAPSAAQVTGCKTLMGYPRYQEKTGDLWEDDVWFDDYIGDYKARLLHTVYYEERAM